MNNTHAPLTPPVWYRQGWPWLLIALPASAVIGSIITLLIALQHPVSLVADDYYREGLAINQQKHRLQHAADLGLRALLRADRHRLALSLEAREPISERSLTLHFIHATRAELDHSVTLRRDGDNIYRAQTAGSPPGYWYLRLEDSRRSWQLRARLRIDGLFQAYLSPAED